MTFDVKSGSSQLKRCELLRANRENSSKEVKTTDSSFLIDFPCWFRELLGVY